jgi:hypothetical protein
MVTFDNWYSVARLSIPALCSGPTLQRARNTALPGPPARLQNGQLSDVHHEGHVSLLFFARARFPRWRYAKGRHRGWRPLLLLLLLLFGLCCEPQRAPEGGAYGDGTRSAERRGFFRRDTRRRGKRGGGVFSAEHWTRRRV